MAPEKPQTLRERWGLDPERFAEIEREMEAREEQRRAREAAALVVPPTEPAAVADDVRKWAAAADELRRIARELRELGGKAGGDG
jgi:hypothetical protein